MYKIQVVSIFRQEKHRSCFYLLAGETQERRSGMADYDLMKKQLEALISDTEWEISVLANASALIWDGLEDINWAGFYIMRGGHLELGPFQGKPACVRIPFGKGVCGTAAAEGETVLVENVHEFAGHIACESDSRSEIVLPICKKGSLYGVLDIDSPFFRRFSSSDRDGLEQFAEILGDGLFITECHSTGSMPRIIRKS